MNKNLDTIERLSELRSGFSCFDDKEEPYYRALSEAIEALNRKEYPAVRQGKWLDGQGFAGNYYDCFVCDQCKEQTMAKINYCPYCGAKMEE